MDFKFSAQRDRQACKPKIANVGQRGVGCVTWPTFYNFGIPLYTSGTGLYPFQRYGGESQVYSIIQVYNTDFKFGVRIGREAYKPENAKVGQKGRGLLHVTYFYNFVPY